MSAVSRREFVLAGAGLCACAACPNLLLAAGKPPVDVGPADAYAAEGVYDRFAASHGFFLVTQKQQLYALSSWCTHERKPLTVPRSRDSLFCAEHKSYFRLNGQVKSGKPTKPLPRFAITRNQEGHIVVDPGKVVADAGDPAGFVKL